MNEGQVITLINHAFADMPVPSKESITGCTCEECMQIREDFAEKQPEDLVGDKMHFHCWDMGFFTAEARQYYLPGWMRLGITQPESGYADAVIQIFGYSKGWATPGGYTDAQRKAISAFLELIRIRNNKCHDLDFDIAWDEWAAGSELETPDVN